MTYTAANHQEAIEIFWLHFWGAVMMSIFYAVSGFNQEDHNLSITLTSCCECLSILMIMLYFLLADIIGKNKTKFVS